MTAPLRRRLRLRALDVLGAAPDALSRPLLGVLASAARFSAYERRTLANLEQALGAETDAVQRARIAREVRHHAARLLREWTFLARARRGGRERERVLAWVREQVELDPSVAGLERAFGAGRGRVLATAHLGNWELLAAALRLRGLDGAVVGFRKRNDPTAEWLVGLRAGLGVETFPQDAPPRRLLEVLRGGGFVGLLADLEARRIAGAVVPFLGRPALTMTAPAALARAARVPVVPVRCVARGARYRLSAEEPLELDPALDRQAATLELTARLNATFERWIREDPGQWAWHQRRWRSVEELSRLSGAG
jgi:KDO2-lipid IV(A) lauroyltransferase